MIWILLAACQIYTNNTAVYQKAAPGIGHIAVTTLIFDFPASEATGSGFVIDLQGHVLTNAHLLKGAHRIQVKLSGGSRLDAKIIGRDGVSDLAVIRIKAPPERLHPLPLGDSTRLRVGQKVLAMGNPFGQGEILTAGIISALGRVVQMRDGSIMAELIQTDASITSYNTGGPLLDATGRVAGVNVALASSSRKYNGLNFAIPVETVKQIIPDLIKNGYVSYPWIGAHFFQVYPDLAQALDLSVDNGLLVANIDEGGPADLASLKAWSSDFRLKVGRVTLPAWGDVVVAADDMPVESVESMVRVLLKHKPGDVILLQVLRRGRLISVPVVLGKRRG